jgi:hypothetical protein
MITIIGQPLVMPLSVAKAACKALVKEYVDASPESQIGEANEKLAYGLVSKLDGQAFLAPKGSAMDCILKGDVILKVGNKALVWQVKSSHKGAENHFAKAKNNSFRGERYPLPGVIVVDRKQSQKLNKRWRMDAVIGLSENAGIALEKPVISAIELHKSSKVRTIPLGKVPAIDKIYTKEVCLAMNFLGLGKIEAGSTLILL